MSRLLSVATLVSLTVLGSLPSFSSTASEPNIVAVLPPAIDSAPISPKGCSRINPCALVAIDDLQQGNIGHRSLSNKTSNLKHQRAKTMLAPEKRI